LSGALECFGPRLTAFCPDGMDALLAESLARDFTPSAVLLQSSYTRVI
jgi:hypothetical protein